MSCLSFFSPLCRLAAAAAQRLPRSWPRHGWPFPLLLCVRIIKNEESRKEQEQANDSGNRRRRRRQQPAAAAAAEKSTRQIGRNLLSLSLCLFFSRAFSFYPRFLSIYLSLSHTPPRTDIPAAYFENDWTRFVSRHVPVYSSLFFLRSLESRQFRRQQYFRPSRTYLPSYAYTPAHPFSLPSFFLPLFPPTFSFDTGTRATIHTETRLGCTCPLFHSHHSSIPSPRSFALLRHYVSSFLFFPFALPLRIASFVSVSVSLDTYVRQNVIIITANNSLPLPTV